MDTKKIKSNKNIMKMIIGSLIGIFYYLVPLNINGKTVMTISLIEEFILKNFKALPQVILYLMVFSAILSIIISFFMKEKLKEGFIKNTFSTNLIGIIWRVSGATFLFLSFYKIGPEWIWSKFTGGLITNELIPMLFVLFLLALAFIALLTDFGILELLGGILSPIFRPLFKLSPKSSVLALASYVGSGTTGMIITDGAHKKKEFTTRDANIIVFGFAIVSLPVTFAYPTGIAKLESAHFPLLALCLIICTIISTFIISRIPPLSKKSNTFIDGTKKEKEEKIKFSLQLKQAYNDALIKVSKAPSVPKMILDGLKEFFDFVIAIFPIIITIATIVLAITEYTTLFNYLAIPIAPILEFLGVPEATKAAPSFVLGFADIFLPFIGASTISSQFTKFVISAVGIMQMYCMSEGIIILLKSSMKIKFKDIVLIFIIRTIISLPIAVLFARMMGLV